ncbi:MAG: hypothetical protein SGPRY_011907, partial [Prymnesium sp.]
MSLSPDPPYLALLGAITLTASQWFDDPEDLPLLYSFFYGDSPEAAEESWTPMSLAKLNPTHIWRNPPAGNFTLSCKVMDAFGAETVTQRQIIVEQQTSFSRCVSTLPQTPFDSSSFEPLLFEIETRIALRDAPEAVQLMDSIVITLNSQCSTSQGFVGPGLCSSLRGRLIDSLGSQSVEGISSLATRQRASLLRSLVSRPSELAFDAMENASVVVGDLLRVSTAGVSSGTAAKLLGSISFLLEGTSRRAQDETNDLSVNQTNCSGCVAALRTERLMNHTAQLAELALEGKAVGETPTAISTPTVAIRAHREDPCRVENTSFESAPFDGGGGEGSVLFPQGTICARRAGRRMQASPSCGETPVSLLLLTFKSVTRAASPPEPLGTPVYSVQVKQCGEETKVSDTISPIRLKMMPLPLTTPSYCRLPAPPFLPAPSPSPPSSPPVAPNEECHPLHGSGICTEDADCHAPTGGKCLEGMCACHLGHLGSECIVTFPTDVDGFLASVNSIQWNTFSIDDVASVVTSFDFDQHRAIYVFFFALTGLNLLCLVWLGWYRQHRTGITRKRMLRKLTQDVRAQSSVLKRSAQPQQANDGEGNIDTSAPNAKTIRVDVLSHCHMGRGRAYTDADGVLHFSASPKDNEALTASQERSVMVQLFFNALMVDFVFACLNAPDNSSATGGGRRGRGSAADDAAQRNAFRIDQFSKIDLVNATITGF